MASKSRNRAFKSDVAKLAKASSGGVVSIQEAARALELPRREAANRMAALVKAGWMARLQRGVYMLLPLEAGSSEVTTVEDPWLLASALFSPGYIGGWTAAEHWGLTEQLFRSTFVATAVNIRERAVSYLGASFKLVRVKPNRIRNLTPVWRGASRVLVSSRERTLIDAAIEPRWVGGFRHLQDVFAAYAEIGSEKDLIAELMRSGTGAAAKRIGYLADRMWPDATKLIEAALEMRSTGVIKLEPDSKRRGSMNTRWRVWVNVG